MGSKTSKKLVTNESVETSDIMKEKEERLKEREEELNSREEKLKLMEKAVEGEKKIAKKTMEREYRLRREVNQLRMKLASLRMKKSVEKEECWMDTDKREWKRRKREKVREETCAMPGGLVVVDPFMYIHIVTAFNL